jgi:hypothetical protein
VLAQPLPQHNLQNNAHAQTPRGVGARKGQTACWRALPWLKDFLRAAGEMAPIPSPSTATCTQFDTHEASKHPQVKGGSVVALVQRMRYWREGGSCAFELRLRAYSATWWTLH